MIKREVKLETMLNSLIERGGYSRNRQPILDSIEVTAAALSQYTCGRTKPSFDRLVRLADFFNVSLDYLVYGEPVSNRIDPAPITRYVEQAFMGLRTRSDRHADLVARIGRLLLDRINEVAAQMSESRSAGIEGLIEREETLRVERYCRRADIITFDLEPNIISMDGGEVAPGQFFPVVVDNITRGCTYRFLLAGELTVQSPCVIRLRDMLAKSVGGDRLHQNCLFKKASSTVTGATVVYQLDTPTLAMEDPGLFTQFGKYLLDGNWLGYLNRPNDDSTADMLMGLTYVEQARNTFEVLWTGGTT